MTSHPPKAPPPNPITLGLGFPRVWVGGWAGVDEHGVHGTTLCALGLGWDFAETGPGSPCTL